MSCNFDTQTHLTNHESIAKLIITLSMIIFLINIIVVKKNQAYTLHPIICWLCKNYRLSMIQKCQSRMWIVLKQY